MRRKSREVLQQAVWAERERMTNLQWELDDCRVALQASEETAQSLQVYLTSSLILLIRPYCLVELLQPTVPCKISMLGGRV